MAGHEEARPSFYAPIDPIRLNATTPQKRHKMLGRPQPGDEGLIDPRLSHRDDASTCDLRFRLAEATEVRSQAMIARGSMPIVTETVEAPKSGSCPRFTL
jgi:hypothetical protein